jgi:hypothetical protein
VGQLLSVYKTRECNAQKVIDYKAAIAAGDCTLPAEPLSKSLPEKIVALGDDSVELGSLTAFGANC